MDSAATLAAAANLAEEFLEDLRALVNIDSGTYTPAGVERVADHLQPKLEALGCDVQRIPGRHTGPQLIAHRRGAGHGRVLLIGHMDTVFPDGEAERRPFTIHDSRAHGPGVLDMKSGLLVGLYALRILSDATQAPYEELTFICNSDEEVGSPESKAIISEAARRADVALVLEPGWELTTVTTARKGVGTFRLDVTGTAAHAGVEPERGRHAILELAHQIVALQALNETIPGVTLNVGVVGGGERPNVVPDHAHALIDIRVTSPEAAKSIQEAMRRAVAKTTIPGTSARMSGHLNHQPFQQSEHAAHILAFAQEEASALGFFLRARVSGGASDGNTTAAEGVPTLDGLGLAGDLAHNPAEYIEIASIAPRVALLAGLLRRISETA